MVCCFRNIVSLCTPRRVQSHYHLQQGLASVISAGLNICWYGVRRISEPVHNPDQQSIPVRHWVHVVLWHVHTVKNMGLRSHQNWCELIATGRTPDFNVMVNPSIMVSESLFVKCEPICAHIFAPALYWLLWWTLWSLMGCTLPVVIIWCPGLVAIIARVFTVKPPKLVPCGNLSAHTGRI